MHIINHAAQVKVKPPTVHQSAMTTYALSPLKRMISLRLKKIVKCDEGITAIRSSEERTMNPHYPTVDTIKIYGKEVRLLATGTCACKSNYSIQGGREAA